MAASKPGEIDYNHWEILEGRETSLTLPADKYSQDYGIELIGGKHSYLGKICIQKIYSDSVAFTDGRLRRGDIVVAINGKSMKNASLEEARQAIVDSSAHPLRITIFRDIDPIKLFTSLEEPKVFVTVELYKNHANEPLGLSLLERKDVGVFVTWITPDSPAGKSNRIKQGDKIIDINGRPVKGMSHREIIAVLRESEFAVIIVFGRIPSVLAKILDWSKDEVPESAATARNSMSSTSDINLNRTRKTKSDENTPHHGKATRRFSAFSQRFRSNSAQIERLAMQPATPVNGPLKV